MSKEKTVEMIVSVDDMFDSDNYYTAFEISEARKRLYQRSSFGTNMPSGIVVYVVTIAEEKQTVEGIISKLNYTVVHELIHTILDSVNVNTEEMAQAVTMFVLKDSENNFSGSGFRTLYQLNHDMKVEVEIETEEAEIENTNLAKNNLEISLEARRLFALELNRARNKGVELIS